MNKGTGLMRPAVGLMGSPSQALPKPRLRKALPKVLSSLDRSRGLIPQSTGSFVGTGVDAAAQRSVLALAARKPTPS